MSLAALTTGAAATRLETDEVIWLTTVRPDGQPQSSPVWFVWDGTNVVVFSRPGAGKVANIAANPLVALHLDDRGDVVVSVEGRAEVAADLRAERVAAYARKYRDGIARLGTDLDAYLGEFSVAIVIRPTRARVFEEV